MYRAGTLQPESNRELSALLAHVLRVNGFQVLAMRQMRQTVAAVPRMEGFIMKVCATDRLCTHMHTNQHWMHTPSSTQSLIDSDRMHL